MVPAPWTRFRTVPPPPRTRGRGGERRGHTPHPLRAVDRARFVRVRLRRGHLGPGLPRDRAGRAHRPRQPRAPRRERLREEHRRRRGPPRQGPLPVPGRGRRRRAASTLPAGGYGVAMVFLPRDAASREACRERGRPTTLAAEGLTLLGWRAVPTDPDGLGDSAPLQPARHRAGVHRPARRPRRWARRRGPRLRAPPVRRPAAHREGRQPERAPRPGRLLHRLDELSHDRLQGDAQRVPAADVLPGPPRRALRGAARARPLAGSRPTPSRRGTGRTRTATSATTARSTRCAGT